MKKKDVQINCQDTAAEKVAKLFELMGEDGSNPSGFKIMFPNGFGVESAQKTSGTRKSSGEWLLVGSSPEMEGTVRLNSLPEGWLSALSALLATKIGIAMSDRQSKINEVYGLFRDNIAANGIITQLPGFPSEQVGWIEDIESVLAGDVEEGSHAAEFYGNGDFTLLGLYEERAGLQLEVISWISEVLNDLEEPKDEPVVDEPEPESESEPDPEPKTEEGNKK